MTRARPRPDFALAWQARTTGTQAMIDLARNTTDLEALAVVAPTTQDRHAPTELIHAILDSPACNAAITGRYATHHDPEVRARVVRYPDMAGTTLLILTFDPDPQIAHTAQSRLNDQEP